MKDVTAILMGDPAARYVRKPTQMEVRQALKPTYLRKRKTGWAHEFARQPVGSVYGPLNYYAAWIAMEAGRVAGVKIVRRKLSNGLYQIERIA